MPSTITRAALNALLPKGPIWVPKVDGGFDNLLEGFCDNLEVARLFLASLADIRDPKNTTLLSDLEKEFGVITDESLTEAARRLYLGAIKYAKPGTGSDDNLEQKLQAAGFDVYVYQNSPAIDPATLLDANYSAILGNTTSVCGNEEAFMRTSGGYLLVNGVEDDENKIIPDFYDRWNYIFFVGGESSGWETFRDWDMEATTPGPWIPGGSAILSKDRTVKHEPVGYRSLKVYKSDSNSVEDIYPVQPDASLQLAYRFRDDAGDIMPIAWKNFLLDGDMEKVGVADWYTITSTLSKETVNPYSGAQCLRVTPSGASSGAAGQSGLQVGRVYRIHGWARTEGTQGNAPGIRNGTITFLWTGITDNTTWEEFDIIYTAQSASINFYSRYSATGYCEFDGISINEIADLTDGDMEAAGTSAWSSGNSALLAKDPEARIGGQSLKVVRNGVNNPYAIQSNVCVTSSYYRLTGYARTNNLSMNPSVRVGGLAVWTGAGTLGWQRIDVIFQAGGTDLWLYTNSTSSAYEGDFDDITISPVLYDTPGLIVGGSPAETIGRYGKQLDSDGTAAFATLSNDPEINRDRSVTISTTVQFHNVTTFSYVFAKGFDVVNNVNLYVIGGDLKTVDGLSVSHTLYTGLVVDKEYHIVYRLDQHGTVVEVFVDNVSQGAQTINAYVLGATQELFLWGRAGPANICDCILSSFEFYTEKKTDAWVKDKFKQVQAAMLSGSYAEQLIGPITESRPLSGYAWASDEGSIPMVLYLDPTDEQWKFAWMGTDVLTEQTISATLPDGISGIRLYAKLGDQSFLPDQALSWFDDITIQDVQIENAEIPASQRAQFEKIIMQVKPLHSWAGLLVDYI